MGIRHYNYSRRDSGSDLPYEFFNSDKKVIAEILNALESGVNDNRLVFDQDYYDELYCIDFVNDELFSYGLAGPYLRVGLKEDGNYWLELTMGFPGENNQYTKSAIISKEFYDEIIGK